MSKIHAFLAMVAMATISMSTIAADITATEQIEQPLNILGIVELGKTPLAEASQKLEAKGCDLTFQGWGASIKPGCYKLPGDPIILLETDWKHLYPQEAEEYRGNFYGKEMPPAMGKSPIVRVVLMVLGTEDSYWPQYLKSMTQSLGRPNIQEEGDLVTTRWFKAGCLAALTRNADGSLFISYIDRDWLKKQEWWNKDKNN